MSFSTFHLHPTLLSNVQALGYVEPTPIQKQAIPAVMAGRDVMGLAQTGTGKTAAFLLPILNRLLAGSDTRRGIRALIVAPTRELAEQIHQSARDLTRKTHIRSATVYGGVGMNPQIRSLRQGTEIIVACPGRLLDHMGQGHVDFSALEVLVLDEADHMFDMGFLPNIRKILTALPAERQSLLFSATMPEAIRGLAEDILRDPLTVRVGTQAPAATVSHAVYPVAPSRKTALLLEFLDRATEGTAIVFTRTKHRAKSLAANLVKAGHKAACIQGNLSQNKRQAALDGFKSGAFRILVATDIAARGIDVSKVAHVINYDIPNTTEAYTHRIGRTGRAECTGEAHTFICNEDLGMVRAIERALGKPLPRKALDGFDAGSPSEAQLPSERPWSGERHGSRFGQDRPSGRNRGQGGPRQSRERHEDRERGLGGERRSGQERSATERDGQDRAPRERRHGQPGGFGQDSGRNEARRSRERRPQAQESGRRDADRSRQGREGFAPRETRLDGRQRGQDRVRGDRQPGSRDGFQPERRAARDNGEQAEAWAESRAGQRPEPRVDRRDVYRNTGRLGD